VSGSDSDFVTLEEIDSIARDIREKVDVRPKVGLVLGSGLGAVADAISKFSQMTLMGGRGRPLRGMLENL